MSAEDDEKVPTRKHPSTTRRRRVRVTKETHPQVAMRLGAEFGALIAPLGDGMTDLERALASLGDRVQETRLGYRLDGKPCNTNDIFKAAGMTMRDSRG